MWYPEPPSQVADPAPRCCSLLPPSVTVDAVAEARSRRTNIKAGKERWRKQCRKAPRESCGQTWRKQ